MKKILFAACAALALFSCDKQYDTPIPDVPAPGLKPHVTLTFIDEPASRAFFATTATAETWEKSLTSLSVYVFSAKGDLITERSFTAAELAAKSATFALPHATAGTTCDFYAVANLTPTGITTKASLLALLERDAANYNGTFQEVTTQSKRSDGFVMSASAQKAIAAEGASTQVALTLKRTVAKVAVQTSIDAEFAAKYSGTIRVTGARILKAASQSPVIAPATPTPGTMSFSHTQNPATAGEKFNNLFYLFENGTLPEASRVMLELTALYDADANASTTADQTQIVYKVPLSGTAEGRIVRNGYYRVAVNLTGLVGQDCQISVTIADWEAPITQNVDLGV